MIERVSRLRSLSCPPNSRSWRAKLFGCSDSLFKYLRQSFFISSSTVSIFRSLWMFAFLMYHGAPVIDRRIFDCLLCSLLTLEALAVPQSCMPYVQIGFIIVLYNRTLYSNLIEERIPINHSRLAFF